MDRFRRLREIRMLDPERDHHAIYRMTALVEFPWDAELCLSLSFQRVFGVPSVAEILDGTGEITSRTARRAEDTGILMFEMIEHGFDHPRGQEAVRRINRLHRNVDITNDDFLYVLGSFYLVFVRWVDRYGWRRLCCHERQAAYVFYRELGRRMGIRDIPATYTAFEDFFDAYEQAQFRYTEAAGRLRAASRGLVVDRFPRAVAPAAGALADALLDAPVRMALGVEDVPPLVRAAVHVGFKARAAIERVLPPRTRSVMADGIDTASYPDGYDIAAVGPPGRSVGRDDLRDRGGDGHPGDGQT